jgi:hypothetical protein
MRGRTGIDMRAIYLRSLLAAFGIAAIVLIQMLLPQEASADPSTPAAVLGAGQRLR